MKVMNRKYGVPFGAGAAALALTMMMASCAGTKKVSNDMIPISDLNGEWNILRAGDEIVKAQPGEETPFLGFKTESSRVYGNAGCNNLMGTYETTDKPGSISLSGLASTMMMCPQMDVEDFIKRKLAEVEGFRRGPGNTVMLVDKKGKTVVLLGKRSPVIKVPELDGKWTVSTVGDTSTRGFEGYPFTVEFNPGDNTFSCTTDCNTLGGAYSVTGSKITFSNIFGTMKACENMEMEHKMTEALQMTSTFNELPDGSVAFYDKSAQLLFIIRK